MNTASTSFDLESSNMQKLLAIFIKHEVKGSASEGGNSNTGRDEPGACPADAESVIEAR
jgi:hypothetical protein